MVPRSDRNGRLWRFTFVLVAVLATTIVPAHAATASGSARQVIVDEGGVGARVPPPGHGVIASALTKDGHQVLVVETRPDGRTVVDHLGREADARSNTGGPSLYQAAADTRACRDGAWADLGVRENDSQPWYFNPAHLPDGIGAGEARRAVVAGRQHLTEQHNDCGIARMSGANAPKAPYQGATSRRANITRDGACGWSDGRNVVSFADLSRSSAIAVSCVWFMGGEVSESDITLDTTGVRWTVDPGPRCRRAIDIASVVVHETGHSFGLAHPEGDHPGLSMNSVIMACSTAYRTLGYGDIRGLRAKYGRH